MFLIVEITRWIQLITYLAPSTLSDPVYQSQISHLSYAEIFFFFFFWSKKIAPVFINIIMLAYLDVVFSFSIGSYMNGPKTT